MRYFRGSRRKKRKASTPGDNAESFVNKTSDEGVLGSTSDVERHRKRSAGDEQGGKKKRNKKSSSASSMTGSTSMTNLDTYNDNGLNKPSQSEEQDVNPMFNTSERNGEIRPKPKRVQKAISLSSSSDLEENVDEDRGESESSSLNIPITEHQRSDREFLLQQIQLLKTEFYLEDCPALSKLKEKNKSHIPLTVLQNALRKVNHRKEDELLQQLNRNAQRKLLKRLHRIGKPKMQTHSVMSQCQSDEQLQRYKEAQWRVSQAEATLKKTKEQHEKLKAIKVLVSQIEAFGNKVDSKTLLEEVKRRNSAGHKCRPDECCVVPASHNQLVETLFSV